MSEFLLHIGKKPHFDVKVVGQALKHFEDFTLYSLEDEGSCIVLTSCDSPHLWSPFRSNSDRISVFMVGRIALTEKDWQIAGEEKSKGGLAGGWVHRLYRERGIAGLKELNGAYTIIVIDQDKNTIHLVTDRCGMFQCFHYASNPGSLFFSSNADVLAKACDISMSWDMTSLSEFVMSGKVSFPYTYYSSIRSLQPGNIYTYHLNEQGDISATSVPYFEFVFEPDTVSNVDRIAEELAFAIESAVRKRTLPIFGKCGISLSGGLDSRTVLGAIKDRSNVVAFTFFDEKNYEFRIAERIAQKAGIDIIPIKRDFDHYGNSSEACVKIGCAMGECFNNHLLGFRENFKQHGIQNILSGFYFDYMFKALALDRQMVPYLGTTYRIEKESNFKLEHYQPYFTFGTERAKRASERIFEILPYQNESVLSEKTRLEIACKRVIPFCYEPDNAETVVSQKVFPWYLPVVDTNVLEVYLRIPVAFRMNRLLSLRLARILGGKEMLNIPDTNTRTRVDATHFERMVMWHLHFARTKLKGYLGIGKKGIATDESWPDQIYYINNSQVIKRLWERPNPAAEEVFQQIAGSDHFRKDIADYKSWGGMYLFNRFFTLKLWMDQRWKE